ncbi:MAG: hypothetical protein KKG76_02970 [Euryarchaeota archaeon]|nr:hypothetical protein [Euryarchaeota archaeon]
MQDGYSSENVPKIRELPDAPLYIVLSLDADDIDKWYARLEAGFVARNMLMQGSAIGMGSGLRWDWELMSR